MVAAGSAPLSPANSSLFRARNRAVEAHPAPDDQVRFPPRGTNTRPG